VFGRLGIQVVTYRNEPAQLERCAQAVAASARTARAAGVERIAVRFGDCAVPPTLDAVAETLDVTLAEQVDAVEFVEFGANLGSAGGSNALADGRDDDAIWVLNPDTYPSPTCAVELLAALAGEGVGAVDGRQVPIEHPKSYDPRTGDTSWVSGSCTMVRRDAFEQVGGYDAEHFPMYCDDVDLSWRLRLAGWRTVHAPRAVVFHDKRIDARGGVTPSPFELRSGTIAGLLLARRYGRSDVESGMLERIERQGTSEERSAADEFLQRSASGEVPEPLEAADRVATFVDGAYAVHRFGYGT
jgi:GT2 family glycosyltransferase